MKTQTLNRGDTRDEAAVRSSGGFIPKDLLHAHAGNFPGFLACTDKVDGRLGCNCAGTTEGELFRNARQKLAGLLLKPMDIQEHVRTNTGGLISAAIDASDVYDGHRYEIRAEWEIDVTFEEASKLGLPIGKLNAFSRDFRLLSNSTNLAAATLFGIIPHKAVEVTFISPVEFRYLRYAGFFDSAAASRQANPFHNSLNSSSSSSSITSPNWASSSNSNAHSNWNSNSIPIPPPLNSIPIPPPLDDEPKTVRFWSDPDAPN